MRKAVVRDSDGFVQNVIEIEEGAKWEPPEGCILVDAEGGGSPGDTWDGEKFIRPPEPPPPEPPRSTHISILTAIDTAKARPATVKRVWRGRDYFYDCFATQTVKDEYQEGSIMVGDYLLVHFDDMGEQIVTAKVFKSW
ncbi:unnamed protein product [marine sediment metagenome]|uniref:Uncharacterized protein n=1 Tax=marine sediment metagenome TaxID=412755 RepID=X1SFR0_9ZZZZ